MTTGRKPLTLSTGAGCSGRTDPSYNSVGVAGVGCQKTRGDVEVTLPPHHGDTFLGISMITPRSRTYVADPSRRKALKPLQSTRALIGNRMNCKDGKKAQET
jgi:hypothetical protein